MKTITRMETLPNEILLRILSHLSWFDALTSFWSLNIRFNSLVCLTLSINNNRSNKDFFTPHGLPYNKCRSILYSLISNSPFLCSSIKNIQFDGSNSTSYDLCYRWLFDDENILRFPNLKSLTFTRCGSVEPVIRSLLYLVEHQLNELTLTFDQYVFHRFHEITRHYLMTSDSINKNLAECSEGRQMNMIKQLLRQIFSEKCQLKYLQLDISEESQHGPLHECLSTNSFYLKSIQTHAHSYCVTLRQIDIRLNSTCFLQNLIERVPNLEQLSVELLFSLTFRLPNEWDIEASRKFNDNWLNKLPKLKCFTLKTFIYEDEEFTHLKWLLNNVNYVEKLEVCLQGYRHVTTDLERIWQCSIDANFVRQYCLPDTILNLIHWDFYIGSVCQSAVDDIEERIKSFRNHPFFQNHQWTDVKCLFDRIRSYQHLFSDFRNSRFGYSIMFDWKYFDRFNNPAYPSPHLLLGQCNEVSPNISSIRLNRMLNGKFNKSDLRISSEMLCKLKQRIDMPFRNVTKIQFGASLNLLNLPTSRSAIERDPIREKVLAQLFSLTVQLKYLQIEQFEWLLHAVQYTSDELRPNALSTIRYVEFLLPSSHNGFNEHIRIGKQLLPLLTTHMPHLQTLRFWRPDDFPWTSIRPDFRKGNAYSFLMYRWLRSLRTDKSIVEHVAVFEQDLCQLFEQLKELTFLDISGRIDYVKMEPYHLMVRTRFPDSRIDVELSRFRLWR